ncbi:MAG: hypothetical protein OEM02_10035 [Desulfobulbaceae bacterium]|nr:hypothetical protein [Desulfobulbaceae bacterium]
MVTTNSNTQKENDNIARIIRVIPSLAGVVHFYIMDWRGKIIETSSSAPDITDFITFTLVSGVKMRDLLGGRGPHRVWFDLQDKGKLLMVPLGRFNVTILLKNNVSVTSMAYQLNVIMQG